MTNDLAAAQEQMPHHGATDEQRAAAIRHVLRRIDATGDTPAQAHEALQMLGLIPDGNGTKRTAEGRRIGPRRKEIA